MISVQIGSVNSNILGKSRASLVEGSSTLQFLQLGNRGFLGCYRGKPILRSYKHGTFSSPRKGLSSMGSKKIYFTAPKCSSSPNSSGSEDDSSNQGKTPFGYTRKDVLLIGLGVTVFGYGLKSGLEFAGVDPLQAGNVVQLVLVLGLTIGWISTYIFRVSNKEMTYAQQLRDYENKVMEKRLEGLSEAELVALLEQVEEEKRSVAAREQID
ncbi:hypothetical protein K2173_027083 [Erythroxylum novogranatense]|uniref:MAR-binding filament-like protein 1-1 n=1 Tax=Erythroxylum novogranatense TaxID=1862640 RepID=A0AAV8TY40_9ROSI|nr:hypothetical protein K2173_027083 [Erythroxylum novogranatense]